MGRIARTFVSFSLILLAGCESRGTYGTSTKSASWSGDKGVPGIDEGSIASFEVWNGPEDPVRFAVWSDLPNETGKSSNGPRGVSVEWRQYSPDGRSVEIRYEADGEEGGALMIAGRTFDPTKGSLFLVRTDREPFRIEQTAFDLARLPLDDAENEVGTKEFEDRSSAVRALAESEPRIGAFFGAHMPAAGAEAEAPAAKSEGREDSIDAEAIERIESRLDEGGANDSFPPYTEPPVEIEVQPIERP